MKSLRTLLVLHIGLFVGAAALGQESNSADQPIPTLRSELRVVYRIRSQPTKDPRAGSYRYFPKESYAKAGNIYEYFQSGNQWVLRELHSPETKDVLSGDGKYRRVWLSDGTDLLRIEHGKLQCDRYKPGQAVNLLPPLPLLGVNTVALPLTWEEPIPPEHVMVPYAPPPAKDGLRPAIVMSAQQRGDTAREKVSTHQLYHPGYVKLGQFEGQACVQNILAIGRGYSDTSKPPAMIDRVEFDGFRLVGGVPVAHHARYTPFDPLVNGKVGLVQDWEVTSISTETISPDTFQRDTYLSPGAVVSETAEHIPVYKSMENGDREPVQTPPVAKSYRYMAGQSWDEMYARSNPKAVPTYKPRTFGSVLIPTAIVGFLLAGGLVVWNVRSRKDRG